MVDFCVKQAKGQGSTRNNYRWAELLPGDTKTKTGFGA
jgi:hypothetical protein